MERGLTIAIKIVAGLVLILLGLIVYSVKTLAAEPGIVCETGPEYVKDIRVTIMKHREHDTWRRATYDNKNYFWCDLSTYHK